MDFVDVQKLKAALLKRRKDVRLKIRKIRMGDEDTVCERPGLHSSPGPVINLR